ncbi:ModE family transcriptional regulator [Clostridium sp. chh4-2]|nr:LysR family transcriptional regulator [Clostridium sp. chh4-2]PNV60792.1 ModE family transcriptional regulator [Clostridium sp. chh4-2]
MDDEKLKFHMRLRVYKEERNFGPGVSTLMMLVRESSSLSAACKEMNMSYSKAWKIIKNAEQDLGFELMEGTRGGESGGGTVLTERGEEFLKRYLEFQEETQKAAQEIFDRVFNGAE